ncbi:hypothetical protein ABH904_004872 [Pseudomonas frederiksbergensis]
MNTTEPCGSGLAREGVIKFTPSIDYFHLTVILPPPNRHPWHLSCNSRTRLGRLEMAQPYEERNSAVKTRRQQEDQRRMEFRRAIEDRSERRQLLAEIGEFPDDLELNYWQAAPATSRRNAQPAR